MLEPTRAMVSLEARDPSESPLLYDPGVAALSLAAPQPPEQETGEPSRRPAIAEDGGQLGTDGVVLKLLLPEKETGHVIGKGGAILTKIKQDSNTRRAAPISVLSAPAATALGSRCAGFGSRPSTR